MVTVHNTHSSEHVPEAILKRLLDALIRQETSSPFEISIVLCDRARHERLHRTFLHHDYPTDVLAFPLGGEDTLEGEVYVDLDTARERHQEFAASFDTEVARYAIHGVLHLLGFDDGDPASRSIMREKEDNYVSLYEFQRT